MNIIRKAVTTLGGVFLAALLIAALAPKAAHGIAASLVQVANTSANPVPTVAADNPADFPFVGFICTGDCGTRLASSFNVPLATSTGVPVKRLVIEDVYVNCFGPTPGGAGLAELLVPTPADGSGPQGETAEYLLAMTVADNNGVAHAAVHIYADPGATITQQGIAGNDICSMNISGHLVTK
jgi:hypothetical protein